MTKILIVDDERVIRDMYQQKCQSQDWQVLVASNGVEGLQTAQQEKPDLILLDVRMPQMDGLTMLKQLRQSDWGKDIKVIILTAVDPNDQIVYKISRSEPSYFLLKSSQKPEGVIEKIKQVLNSEAQNGQNHVD